MPMFEGRACPGRSRTRIRGAPPSREPLAARANACARSRRSEGNRYSRARRQPPLATCRSARPWASVGPVPNPRSGTSARFLSCCRSSRIDRRESLPGLLAKASPRPLRNCRPTARPSGTGRLEVGAANPGAVHPSTAKYSAEHGRAQQRENQILAKKPVNKSENRPQIPNKFSTGLSTFVYGLPTAGLATAEAPPRFGRGIHAGRGRYAILLRRGRLT